MVTIEVSEMSQSRRVPSKQLFALGVVALVLPGASSAAPGTGRLLGTDAGAGVLLDVDRSNGSASRSVPWLWAATPSRATDPVTGTSYVATGGGRPALFTFDPADASASLVGHTGLGRAHDPVTRGDG